MSAAAARIADESAAPDAARLVALAAHEIRTPLGGVLALADLILAEDLPDAARGHADALKAAAEHLLRVATGLLGGVGEARPGALDLALFLPRATAPIAARAALKGLSFGATRGPGVPDRVIVDEAALRRIIDNLADNALRATASGGLELVLETSELCREWVTLNLAMRDTGPGLGERPERLFEPYVQGDRSVGAAGLGLSVVAELAQGMGGHADARNLPGRGAEISVTLRLGLPPGLAPDGRPFRVLVAEDNAVNQRVVSTLLEHFGHQHDIVETGAAAVAAVAGGTYDLVLMDARMPTLDGLAATRAIRAMEGDAASIRIVGLTANAFDDDLDAFLAAGADAVVTKPISVAELWRAIGGGREKAA